MRWRSARTLDELYMDSPTASALGGPESVVWILSAIYPSKRSNAPQVRANLTFPRPPPPEFGRGFGLYLIYPRGSNSGRRLKTLGTR